MSIDLAGIYPAFLTPLSPDRHVVPSVAEALLAHLMSTGVSGTYVAGSTGEGLRMEVAERERLVEILGAALPTDKKMIVHVGASSTADALRLAKHAARHGAKAISSLPPKGDSQAIYTYYETLARESELPLIVYYFPKIAPAAFQDSRELFAICELPNVAGVKFTDFNTYLLQGLSKRGHLVFNGYDEALAAGLLMGARGGIGSTYNIMPQVYLEIFRAAQRGDWETARVWQQRVGTVIDILLRYPFAPALRAVMAHRGFDCGPLMSGEEFASAGQKAQLIADFDKELPKEIAELIGWK